MRSMVCQEYGHISITRLEISLITVLIYKIGHFNFYKFRHLKHV